MMKEVSRKNRNEGPEKKKQDYRERGGSRRKCVGSRCGEGTEKHKTRPVNVIGCPPGFNVADSASTVLIFGVYYLEYICKDIEYIILEYLST